MSYDPPVIGPITCDYACHLAGARTGGIDYGVPVGTPIHAIDGGMVTVATNNGGTAGIYIEIDHGRLHSRYLHLSARAGHKVGDPVFVRQVIGYSGSTGQSTGPHLHHDVGTAPGNVQRINPQTLFDAPPVQEDDMIHPFKRDNHPAVYRLDGGTVVHITGSEWNINGYSDPKNAAAIATLPATHSVWKAPVLFPEGLPGELN
jgi:murein DD-endopeptidase MepM/ murein hydrolase activator NlpD